MTPYEINAEAWQESWDRQQEAFMPDREERFTAMLAAVDAATDGQPLRVLDLAGGTGSLSLRVLRQFPDTVTTLVDVDPVLLAIARATLPTRGTVISADLRTPDWVAALPYRDYDAVLTATALHWLAPERLTTLYREVRTVLRPGGVLVNADHMPDDGLPGLSERLTARAQARREARYVAGAVLSWPGWWENVAADPTLGPLVAQRRKVFDGDHSREWHPAVSWHHDALRSAGYAEVGLVWRGAGDAAMAAIR
jgi:ubiquinone/menaquinone biosynthesis C-methylase UbiE